MRPVSTAFFGAIGGFSGYHVIREKLAVADASQEKMRGMAAEVLTQMGHEPSEENITDLILHIKSRNSSLYTPSELNAEKWEQIDQGIVDAGFATDPQNVAGNNELYQAYLENLMDKTEGEIAFVIAAVFAIGLAVNFLQNNERW